MGLKTTKRVGTVVLIATTAISVAIIPAALLRGEPIAAYAAGVSTAVSGTLAWLVSTIRT